MMKANLRVLFAYATNNFFGKREDVHGRTYRYVCKKFGRAAMVREYIDGNSWLI